MTKIHYCVRAIFVCKVVFKLGIEYKMLLVHTAHWFPSTLCTTVKYIDAYYLLSLLLQCHGA